MVEIMSELIISCCDFCNTEQSISHPRGRGYVVVPEEDAVQYFDWIRDENGNIKCLDCQNEELDKVEES
jgi:hypothetical protein